MNKEINEMTKNEIEKITDKDLQLRYYLGGLKLISDGIDQLCTYWTDDINCSCNPVSADENFIEVKKYVQEHNLTNKRFLKLSYALLRGSIMKYKGEYTPLFVELEKILAPYNFVHMDPPYIPDNDFHEKQLEEIAYKSLNGDLSIKEYCDKYKLSIEDFIALGKTSINYGFNALVGLAKENDDFGQELRRIIDSYDLYVPFEYIKEYREKYKDKIVCAELLVDIKVAQKKYLELMKQLIEKNYYLATEIFADELRELGIRKNASRLLKRK